MKTGAELSTDHYLIVSWIRWWEEMLDRPGVPKHIVRVHWECLPQSSRSSVFISGRASIAFQGRPATLSPSGQCSAPALLRLLQRAATERLLVVGVLPFADVAALCH